MHTRWAVCLVTVAVLAVVAVMARMNPGAAPAPEISVSRSSCGLGWADPKPGEQSFRLHNTGSVAAEVDLINPRTGTIYGEVEGLGPGTMRPLRVTLGTGDYAFRCLLDETAAMVGPVAKVIGGDGHSGPAVVPVTEADLVGPLRAYQDRVTAGLGTLVEGTGALKAAVQDHDRIGARSAWLSAHLSYERLGAAYRAFGDSDAALNGIADGLAGGTADPEFTGFHRVEFGLWHDEDMAALGPIVDRLDADASRLRRSFPDMQIDPSELGVRGHEIMENALQFELTGRTDYGSGTNLATAQANLDGTRMVLDVLRPLLISPSIVLSDVDSWLDRSQAALDGGHLSDGSWVPLARLDQRARQKINGVVGELTERLAPIAAVTEPRRVS